MSNTESDQTEEEQADSSSLYAVGTGPEGALTNKPVYTTNDLRRDVRFGSSLSAIATGAKVSRGVAEDLLKQRLAKMKLDRYDSSFWSLDSYEKPFRAEDENDVNAMVAQFIVDTWDDDLLTENLVNQIDLRPYFAAIDTASKNGYWLDARKDDNGYEMGNWLDAEEKRLRSDYGQGSTLPVDQTEKRLDQILAYDPSTVEPLPDLAQAQISTTDANAPWVPGGATQQMSNYGFPTEHFRELLNADMMNLDQLLSEEDGYQQEFGGGMFPVSVDGFVPPVEGFAGRDPYETTGSRMSARNAILYLNTLDQKEVATLQRKMAAAGYFDRTRSGNGYLEGDATDTVTKEAWRLLLTDSMKANRPVTLIIAENARNYRQTVQRERLRNVAATDPTYVQVTANDWAQRQIGRNLTKQELNELNTFLTNLTRDRAGFVQGARDNVADQGLFEQDGKTYGWSNQDIELQLQKEFDPEIMQAHMGQLAYFAGRQMGIE